MQHACTSVSTRCHSVVYTREPPRYGIDICALSETCCADEGSICEPEGAYTFFWKDTEKSKSRTYGVGFAIQSSLLRQLPDLPTGLNERLMKLCIPLTHTRHVTIISAYDLTLTSSEEDKEAF